MMNDDRKSGDWKITLTLVLSGVVVTLIALGTPAVISASNTTEQVAKGTELTGCRSTYAAVVTDRRTEFDIARSHRDTAAALRDNAQIAVTAEALFGDASEVPGLLTDLATAGTDVEKRNADVEAADKALIAANDEYQAAIALSRTDPSAFLAECKEQT